MSALALSGCATLPPVVPQAADCRANYLGLDEQVDAADVQNGGAHRIDGFPYLRSDRFLASFADEAGDGPAFDAWVERMRELDLESRASELRNLGWANPGDELAHLDRCGAEWAALDLADPARREQLRARVKVPDDYSWWRRTLGLYPLAVPFLNLGISGFNKEVKAEYARPHEQLDTPGKLVLWQPGGAQEGVHGRDFFAGGAHGRDALGIPSLSPADWDALARMHQPNWLVETDGEFDRPGAPVLGDVPRVDPARPVNHVLGAYTRFGDKVLAQLVYIVWFSERPKSAGYSYGGPLDGVVWRVTLDEDFKPLLYDTIHACGCYHYYFMPEPAPGAAPRLQRREQGGFWQEPVLFPQRAPAQPFAIRLQSATHYVRRLVPLSGLGATERATYALADYDELLTLPDGDRTRSLFSEDGIACGTERFERFWLWPAGVKSAGAMRQWGRHATSFVGRSHFDDPEMMDRLFEPR